MPEVPIKHLEIYDPQVHDTSVNNVGAEPVLGRHLYKLMKFVNDVKQTASTTEGRIKIGTTAASPLLGLILARRWRNGLVKFTSTFCTTGAVFSVNYPTHALQLSKDVSNYTMLKYQKVSENHRRLFIQLKEMNRLEDCKALMNGLSDEKCESIKEMAPEKVAELDLGMNPSTIECDDDVIIDIPKHFPLLLEEDDEMSSMDDKEDDEDNDDDGGDDGGARLLPDIFLEHSEFQTRSSFDFGQSTKEDDDMFPARDRE